MFAAGICYTVIGGVVGFVFALLFINFDKSWKKILSFLLGVGGTGGLIVVSADYFELTKQSMKFLTTTCLFVAFLIAFIIMMFIMCKLIRDKDDNDILRIRDILLGQKSYIDKYYEKRSQEIDVKLGIPVLEERERKVSERERKLEGKEQFIEEQKEDLQELGKSKLKIKIPYNNDIVLSKNLLNSMPEYIYGMGKFIVNLREATEEYCKFENPLSLEEFKSYLLSVSTYVIKDIFETNSDGLRVHFRYYDEKEGSFDTLTVINGKEMVTKKLTPIPYENSLIKKSYECRRALIKSVNEDYTYESNNYTVWQDYMTYSFYGLVNNNIPIITFGISVKNSTIHKNKFYFLSYFNIEQYLEESMSKINEKHDIKKIFYLEV